MHVPTLRTADDFPAWKQAVRLACMSLDVWDCVTGDEAEPENRELQRIFRRSDRKAFAILQSSIAPNLLQVVKEAQTSRETLEALEAHFGDASLSNKVYLKRSLFKLQQDELQSCLDVTSQILAIADRLSQMRFELSPLDLVIVLLAALHPRFDLWVEQIERLPDDQLTWANVTRKLFHEETRLARLEQRMEALAVSARGAPKRASKTESGSKPVHDPKDDLVCTYCAKRRHTENRCFKRAKDLKLQSKKSAQNFPRKSKSASAYVARASEVTSDYESAEEEF